MQKRTKIIVSTLILWMAAAATEGFTSFAAQEAHARSEPNASLLAWQSDCLPTSSCGVSSVSLP